MARQWTGANMRWLGVHSLDVSQDENSTAQSNCALVRYLCVLVRDGRLAPRISLAASADRGRAVSGHRS
jgi:hypothetical protein